MTAGRMALGVNVTALVRTWNGHRWALDRVIRSKNLVVNAGANLVRDFLDQDVSAPTAITHCAVGTSATAPVPSSTTLGTEVVREAITSTTPGAQQLTISYFMASGVGNGNTLREAGLFNASSGGSMYARVVLSTAIVKDSSKSVTFTWTLTFTGE